MNLIGAVITIVIFCILVGWAYFAMFFSNYSKMIDKNRRLNQAFNEPEPDPQGGCSCTKRRCAEQAGEGNKGRS